MVVMAVVGVGVVMMMIWRYSKIIIFTPSPWHVIAVMRQAMNLECDKHQLLWHEWCECNNRPSGNKLHLIAISVNCDWKSDWGKSHANLYNQLLHITNQRSVQRSTRCVGFIRGRHSNQIKHIDMAANPSTISLLNEHLYVALVFTIVFFRWLIH